MVMYRNVEQDIKFISSFLSTVFSTLGWVNIGFLSPNIQIWWYAIPVIIFIVFINTQMMICWIWENKNKDKE